MTIELTSEQLYANSAIFDWCLRNGRRAISRRHYIQAMRWCQLAAETAGFGCGLMVSQELEVLLQEVARQLPIPITPRSHIGHRKRWLHVLSETAAIGGHTILVKRWIEADQSANQHSVVVLLHRDSNDGLKETVEKSGGTIVSLDASYNRPLECAQSLREFAWAHTDYVVLHTHMWDVLSTVAFGIPGGPTVLLLNHADHLFWVGASVSDLVLNLRHEGNALSEQYRGIDRNYLLNIPLPEQPLALESESSITLRERLGIPADALIFLTIGRASKYEPREGISFISSATEVLRQVPGAYLIAVGPSMDNPAWLKAHEETQGRLIAVGTQHNLRPYHLASDIYLEGFPFGSLTALLEAGLAGLPCVRAPGVLPAIYKSSGPSIDDLPIPADPVGYVKLAVELATLPHTSLKRMGEALSAKVDHVHRSGWVQQLANMPLPDRHRVYPLRSQILALPLAEAKMLRWVDGDAIKQIRWKASQLGVDASVDFDLLISAFRLLPNTDFLCDLYRKFLERPVRRPQTKSIS